MTNHTSNHYILPSFVIIMAKTISKQQSARKRDFRNVGVLADYAQINNTWEKFGYSELQLMNTNADGQIVSPSGYKIEIQKRENNKEEPFVRCTIPASQPFVPFEAVDEVVYSLEKRITDTFPEAKKNNFKIEYISKKVSSKGNTMHWLVQTNQVDTIPNSHTKNDEVKLGFAVRNGYNTGVVLGIDIFTFRLVCSNGAIARGRDLAQKAIRHVGKDPKALLKSFQEGLMLTMQDWSEVLQTYKKMAKVRLNEEMARYIYEQNKWTPEKYFPEYYNIPTAEEQKKGQLVALTNAGKSVTLWENFNDMTQGLWHAQEAHTETNKKGEEIRKEGIAFKGIAKKEKNLHSAMSHIINNPELFV